MLRRPLRRLRSEAGQTVVDNPHHATDAIQTAKRARVQVRYDQRPAPLPAQLFPVLATVLSLRSADPRHSRIFSRPSTSTDYVHQPRRLFSKLILLSTQVTRARDQLA